MLADVGVGRVFVDGKGQKYTRRYAYEYLSTTTLKWLQQNRVPGYMSGIGRRADTQRDGPRTDETTLRGTNPSLTVRATAVMASLSVAARTATQGTEAAMVATEHSEIVQRQKPQQVLFSSELVEGVFMDKKACKQYMREKLREQNVSAEVNDIRPVRHNKYFLFKGMCLRCLNHASAAVYRGTYYRRDLGVPAKTFTIFCEGTGLRDSTVVRLKRSINVRFGSMTKLQRATVPKTDFPA